MTIRKGECTSCGAETTSGERGAVPKSCESCAAQRQREASQRWKDRNRDEMNAARRDQWVTDQEAAEAARARHRRWYEANRERVSEYRKRLYRERQASTNTAAVTAYRRANPGKHAEIENRRRARLLEQFVENVDPAAIRLRDKDLCGICGTFVPMPQASLDHIIPLALGGTHETANVQLAHRICNSRKGVRLGVVAVAENRGVDRPDNPAVREVGEQPG